ncbi:hypothetical protein SLEP1_g54228 [Rubroshorea leprosula]|uniref:Uncharacterized protein n=1 Tax=Rubroshorea leprosula TaxID=152421 RepID=A0AAV5MBS0_9ROSI|nr:hypothetical protein SLEP1_g54228 [Rubroshorea leprosula]
MHPASLHAGTSVLEVGHTPAQNGFEWVAGRVASEYTLLASRYELKTLTHPSSVGSPLYCDHIHDGSHNACSYLPSGNHVAGVEAS